LQLITMRALYMLHPDRAINHTLLEQVEAYEKMVLISMWRNAEHGTGEHNESKMSPEAPPLLGGRVHQQKKREFPS
ncbi:hypothetical protein MKX03_018984, partial [Papaver bracteatum]